jgi:hypothetical protein
MQNAGFLLAEFTPSIPEGFFEMTGEEAFGIPSSFFVPFV